MSLLEKIKSMFSGDSSADADAHAGHDHSGDGHSHDDEHGHDHSHDPCLHPTQLRTTRARLNR